MSYCKHCDRVVEGQKPYSKWAALGWFIITISGYGVPGLIGYTLYWAFIKKPRCPICKSEVAK